MTPLWKNECDTLVPHYFVGDSAFSLTEKKNAFGILSAKFRIFHSTLGVKPKKRISIVHSCLALHNFLINKCAIVYTHPGSLDYEKENGEVIAREWRQTGDNKLENLALPGINQMRDYLSEYVNGPGQVLWQWKIL